ncbi:MAG: DUF1109 domain-containing protein [Paracoccaceae bacterium]
MRTEDLIRALSQDATVAPAPERRVLPLFLPAVALSMLGLLLILGPRPDLQQALVSFVPVMRHVLSLALFVVAFRAALRLIRPEGRAALWPLAGVTLAALAMLVWAYVTTPADLRMMALMGKTNQICLIAIPVLSVLPVAALFAALRHGATTSPRLTGALIGLAGGGAGAAVYAVHCTESSPLFYVTWYGLAVLIVTAVSALIGPRILRW